ncbi:MAG: chemotaxis response regulator protein-glutamate methylesterase [Gammaproteobacteria bacterium]|nr:chemotaxis response regulator protein-glutamate methylesterase [Gammaproteobacteria bacterium]
MRIAIVNDMPLAVESLRRGVLATGVHQIAWVAYDGAEAVRRCAEDKPDLILMDLMMPVTDGVDATRRIMAETPCPILIVTGSVDSQSARVFEALGAGALDAVNTPVLGLQGAAFGCDTCETFQSKLRTIEKLIRPLPSSRCHPLAPQTGGHTGGMDKTLVVIGSSTGGPQALAQIVSSLPADYPAPIVIVQHVDAQFVGELSRWLDKQTPLHVRLAREGDHPAAGTVLIAGTNDHLVMYPDRSLGYTPLPREQVYRPSVDVFFWSVSEYWAGRTLGVLLTGMGRDSAQGLLKLRNKGAHTIAQDQASCAVYGMPKAAVELDAAVEILPVDRIPAVLIKHFSGAADTEGRGVRHNA